MAIKLPARKYLTFLELQSRWSCLEGDLRYLIANEQLKPAVKAIKDCTIPDWEWLGDVDGMQPIGVAVDGITGMEMICRPKGWLYLQSPHQTGPLNCEFWLANTRRDPNWPLFDGIAEPGWYGLRECVSVDDVIAGGAFLMEEVLRYEGMNDADAIEQRSSNLEIFRESGAVAEMNTMKALGLMAWLLSENKSALQIGSKPNAAKIGDAVSAMAKKAFGADTKGFEAFHKKVGKALKLLSEENNFEKPF